MRRTARGGPHAFVHSARITQLQLESHTSFYPAMPNRGHGHAYRRLFTLLYFTYPAIPLERGMGAGIGLYRHKHHAVITDVGF